MKGKKENAQEQGEKGNLRMKEVTCSVQSVIFDKSWSQIQSLSETDITPFVTRNTPTTNN